MAPAIAPNPSRLPDMFFLSSKSSPSEPEEMVWMSSLSTAGAAVWPAAGFRLAPLSPSLSVLLDSVSTSCGGAGVRVRKGSERRRPLVPLPFVRQKGAEATARGRGRHWTKENEAGSRGQSSKNSFGSNYGDEPDERKTRRSFTRTLNRTDMGGRPLTSAWG